MLSSKRSIALTLLLCVVLLALLSEAFLIAYADHEHDDNGVDSTCATCVLIHNVEKTLRQLGATAAVSLLFGVFLAIAGILRFLLLVPCINTPVYLKTRINC